MLSTDLTTQACLEVKGEIVQPTNAELQSQPSVAAPFQPSWVRGSYCDATHQAYITCTGAWEKLEKFEIEIATTAAILGNTRERKQEDNQGIGWHT